MTRSSRFAWFLLLGMSILAVDPATSATAGGSAEPLPPLLSPRPAVVLDLDTAEGTAAVGGAWRYHDIRIAEVGFRSPGPDRKASGPPNRTYDFEPHAQARDFDDSAWEVLAPGTLQERRAAGKLCMNWYRFRVNVPSRIGDYDPTGSTLVFEITVDDYAEVWVDGELPRELGRTGGPLIAGWNAPNRLVLGRDLRPGQTIQLAVFGMNGPVSEPPANFIWVRSAKLEFYSEPRVVTPRPAEVTVRRLDPRLDALLPGDLRAEKLAEGFTFIEGPVWSPDGYLLFSDPNQNRIYRWSPADGLSVYRERSGYAGADVAAYGQPGSNGLALDGSGRLTACEHGNRRVTRTEADGTLTVLADRFEGKRLNSPNDLVYRSDGTLFFTDPPFGLPQFHDDPRRELPVTGVYSLHEGRLRLVEDELSGPNGLALSPDENTLYVANWDEGRKIVKRYAVHPDGSLSDPLPFADLTDQMGWQALDGLKVDARGNVYVSGPGGVWIFDPDGTRLGVLELPELPANFAWGDADRRTLYLTSRTGLYRMRLEIPGSGAFPVARAAVEAR